MKESLLILGDSHAACWGFIKDHNILPEYEITVRGIGGATARGIANPNSSSKALPIWKKMLDKQKDKFDWISIGLGEVDCNFMIWYRIENNKSTAKIELDKSINPYCEFINYLATKSKNKIIIRGCTLPTVIDYTKSDIPEHNLRGKIKASYRDRTNLTLEFNKRMKEFAKKNDYLYIDVVEETIDEKELLLKSIYRKQNNHHLPKIVAACLWTWNFKKIIREVD